MTSRRIALLIAVLALLTLPARAQTYALLPPIPIGGVGGWDYLKADSEDRRLYVSHNADVIVFDLDTHQKVGQMSGFGFIHGTIIVHSLDTGFLSDGQKNEVVTFDPASLQLKAHIKTMPAPNSMAYDAATGYLFVGHKASKTMEAIKASVGQVDRAIQLPGIPEFPITDDRGNLFVNIEDKNEIIRIDAKSLTIAAHYPLAPCEGPSGLAIDTDKRRLFAACGNKLMAIVNADTGAVVATVPIGGSPDAAAFDPVAHLAFSSNGDGTLTIVQDRGGDRYETIQTLKTEFGARTMAVDLKSHSVFSVTANFGPPPVATLQNPHPTARRPVLPDSFRLLSAAQIAVK